MVGGSGQCTDTIGTLRKTSGNFGLKTTVSVAGIVDALEESESDRVGGSLGVDIATQVLDSDMDVTNDNTLVIELLWSGVIRSIRVRESTGLEVVDLELNGEILVGFKVFVWSREQDHSSDHVLRGRDVPHHYSE